MGSIQDEMKKILNDWENNRFVYAQPKEPQVQNTQTTQTKTTTSITAAGNPPSSRGPGTFTYEVLDYVRQNPGCNGIQVREAMLSRFPKQRLSQTASTLKQLTDDCWLVRTETRISSQKSFIYEAVPMENRAVMFKRKTEMRKKLRNNAALAREALAAKRAAAKAAASAAEERKTMSTMAMPTEQIPLIPRKAPLFGSITHAAIVEAPMQAKQETSSVSIRLTLSIAGQDVKVTIPEAVQLHRQLSELLGV